MFLFPSYVPLIRSPRTNGSVAAHILDWLNRTRTHTHTYTLYLFTCIHNVAFAHCSHTADPRFHDAAFRSFALMPRLPSSCSFFSHCLSQTPSSIFACPALLTNHTLSITQACPPISSYVLVLVILITLWLRQDIGLV